MTNAKSKVRIRIGPGGEKIIIRNVGSRIRQWRKEQKLNATKFSKIIKISQGSLSEIENNKTCPSLNTVAKINRYTGADINWLIFGDVKKIGV